MNTNTLVLRKSTIKTIEMTYGFDFAEIEEEAADYGYTAKYELGCYALVDENGESVDYGHPVLISYQGRKYPGVLWCERESIFDCGREWFSTVLDENINTDKAF